MSLLPSQRLPEPLPFFTPPHRPGASQLAKNGFGKGKGQRPEPNFDPEQEVDDREWELRVGEYVSWA
jgi:hypothetical protein